MVPRGGTKPPTLEEFLQQVQVIDVREQEEYEGPLGHIPGALLIPLDELSERTDEIDQDIPIVTIFRAGGRSAQAAVILQSAVSKSS